VASLTAPAVHTSQIRHLVEVGLGRLGLGMGTVTVVVVARG
jgi:hypothetical protein